MKKNSFDKKKIIYIISFLVLFVIFGISIFYSPKVDNNLNINTLEGEVIYTDNSSVTIRDSSGNEYIVNSNIKVAEGNIISLKYTGVLDLNSKTQDIEVVDYAIQKVSSDNIPSYLNDKGIFSQYYDLAYDKLKELTLEEKIGQLLLVRYPDKDQEDVLKKYNLSGFVFYEKDFKNKTKDEVKTMINDLQEISKIPLITAVDEEGGKVVRISSNTSLRDKPFLSPSELYSSGGLDRIAEDTKEKSKLLKSVGINVNLAPVIDVSTNSSDYIYERTLKEDTNIVSKYAERVIKASKGTGVSYTLKHFPGYGNNEDTHLNKSVDTRNIEDIMNNDILPFKSGIDEGAEAVLISHNIVSSIDTANPASLSPNVHTLLRDDLKFTGVIITDDIAMDAVSSIENVSVFAVTAGNNLIITTDYENTFNNIKSAVIHGEIEEKQIDELAFKVLAWKYYKSLMFNNIK